MPPSNKDYRGLNKVELELLREYEKFLRRASGPWPPPEVPLNNFYDYTPEELQAKWPGYDPQKHGRLVRYHGDKDLPHGIPPPDTRPRGPYADFVAERARALYGIEGGFPPPDTHQHRGRDLPSGQVRGAPFHESYWAAGNQPLSYQQWLAWRRRGGDYGRGRPGLVQLRGRDPQMKLPFRGGPPQPAGGGQAPGGEGPGPGGRPAGQLGPTGQRPDAGWSTGRPRNEVEWLRAAFLDPPDYVPPTDTDQIVEKLTLRALRHMGYDTSDPVVHDNMVREIRDLLRAKGEGPSPPSDFDYLFEEDADWDYIDPDKPEMRANIPDSNPFKHMIGKVDPHVRAFLTKGTPLPDAFNKPKMGRGRSMSPEEFQKALMSPGGSEAAGSRYRPQLPWQQLTSPRPRQVLGGPPSAQADPRIRMEVLPPNRAMAPYRAPQMSPALPPALLAMAGEAYLEDRLSNRSSYGGVPGPPQGGAGGVPIGNSPAEQRYWRSARSYPTTEADWTGGPPPTHGPSLMDMLKLQRAGPEVPAPRVEALDSFWRDLFRSPGTRR